MFIILPKDSNQLPAVFNTKESITKTNNSTNIRKNFKSFLDMPIGPGEVVFTVSLSTFTTPTSLAT
jgi:hypothetical protein